MLSPRVTSSARRHFRQGDTAKVVIIVLASLFALFLVTCAGVGVLGYVWWQKNFSRMMVTKPEDIRALTSEIADITLPPEFHPEHGMAIMGMKVVTYRWCPSGTCPPVDQDTETRLLTLSAMNLEDMPGGAEAAPDVDEYADDMMSDEVLNDAYVNYTKEIREFTIRGQACKFTFLRGEERDWSEMDDGDVAAADSPATTDDAATPAAVAPADGESKPDGEPKPDAEPERPKKGTGKVIVVVQGRFPGKEGEVTLNFQVPADKYQEDKIVGVIESIK